MLHPKIDLLVDALKSLPGVGLKAAEKMALFLLYKNEDFIDEFVRRIYDVKQKLGFCAECNFLVDYTTTNLCEYCAHPHRNKEKICVVASLLDAYKIENAKIFNGLYYVLNGELSAKKNINLESLNIQKLLQRIDVSSEENLQEIIIATNPTLDGQLTAKALSETLFRINPKIKIYRLAFGLPYNSQINYSDDISLEQSMINKQEIQFISKTNFKKEF